MQVDWLWEFLGWLALPILAVLSGRLLWQRAYREFPLFLCYVFGAALIGVVRLVAYQNYGAKAYSYVYWYSDFVVVLLALLAIYEVFLRRIFPAFYKVRVFRSLFPVMLAVIAILAFASALRFANQDAAFVVTSRVFDFVRSAVIGFFVALILLLRRDFKGRDFAITCGFGIQAAAALGNAAITARAHSLSAITDRIEIVAYDAACVIWLITFWKPEKPPQPASAEQLDPEILQQARNWESSLKEKVLPRKRES